MLPCFNNSSNFPRFIFCIKRGKQIFLIISYRSVRFQRSQKPWNLLFTSNYLFFDKNKILCFEQFGFRKGYFISDAINKLVNSIKRAFGNKEKYLTLLQYTVTLVLISIVWALIYYQIH